mmetsp:Transcript_1807/g.2407  ORF Transcript_1807/g.2407 Transcript_1807/m.2407 type:complete len:118 (+) Transcript_1807:1091-1444(+)
MKEINEKDSEGRYPLEVSELEVLYLLQKVNRDNYIDFLTILNDQKAHMDDKPNIYGALQNAILAWVENEQQDFDEFIEEFRQTFTFLPEPGNMLSKEKLLTSLRAYWVEKQERQFGR